MESTLRAAYITAVASIAAAVISLGGQAIAKGDSPSSDNSRAAAPQTEPPPGGCAAMIRAVRELPRSDPELAAELARSGDANLPSLWSVTQIEQCGGVAPERLLEGRLSP